MLKHTSCEALAAEDDLANEHLSSRVQPVVHRRQSPERGTATIFQGTFNESKPFICQDVQQPHYLYSTGDQAPTIGNLARFPAVSDTNYIVAMAAVRPTSDSDQRKQTGDRQQKQSAPTRKMQSAGKTPKIGEKGGTVFQGPLPPLESPPASADAISASDSATKLQLVTLPGNEPSETVIDADVGIGSSCVQLGLQVTQPIIQREHETKQVDLIVEGTRRRPPRRKPGNECLVEAGTPKDGTKQEDAGRAQKFIIRATLLASNVSGETLFNDPGSTAAPHVLRESGGEDLDDLQVRLLHVTGPTASKAKSKKSSIDAVTPRTTSANKSNKASPGSPYMFSEYGTPEGAAEQEAMRENIDAETSPFFQNQYAALPATDAEAEREKLLQEATKSLEASKYSKTPSKQAPPDEGKGCCNRFCCWSTKPTPPLSEVKTSSVEAEGQEVMKSAKDYVSTGMKSSAMKSSAMKTGNEQRSKALNATALGNAKEEGSDLQAGGCRICCWRTKPAVPPKGSEDEIAPSPPPAEYPRRYSAAVRDADTDRGTGRANAEQGWSPDGNRVVSTLDGTKTRRSSMTMKEYLSAGQDDEAATPEIRRPTLAASALPSAPYTRRPSAVTKDTLKGSDTLPASALPLAPYTRRSSAVNKDALKSFDRLPASAPYTRRPSAVTKDTCKGYDTLAASALPSAPYSRRPSAVTKDTRKGYDTLAASARYSRRPSCVTKDTLKGSDILAASVLPSAPQTRRPSAVPRDTVKGSYTVAASTLPSAPGTRRQSMVPKEYLNKDKLDNAPETQASTQKGLGPPLYSTEAPWLLSRNVMDQNSPDLNERMAKKAKRDDIVVSGAGRFHKEVTRGPDGHTTKFAITVHDLKPSTPKGSPHLESRKASFSPALEATFGLPDESGLAPKDSVFTWKTPQSLVRQMTWSTFNLTGPPLSSTSRLPSPKRRSSRKLNLRRRSSVIVRHTGGKKRKGKRRQSVVQIGPLGDASAATVTVSTKEGGHFDESPSRKTKRDAPLPEMVSPPKGIAKLPVGDIAGSDARSDAIGSEEIQVVVEDHPLSNDPSSGFSGQLSSEQDSKNGIESPSLIGQRGTIVGGRSRASSVVTITTAVDGEEQPLYSGAEITESVTHTSEKDIVAAVPQEQVSVEPKQAEEVEQRDAGNEILFCILCVALLLLAVIIAVVLFLTLNVFSQSRESSTTNSHITTSKITTTSIYHCSTALCNQEGEYIKSLLSSQIKPCDNFYAYVCDAWEKHNPYDSHVVGSVVSPDTMIESAIARETLPFLKNATQNDVKIAQRLYEECTDRSKAGKAPASARDLFRVWTLYDWPRKGNDNSTMDEVWKFAGELIRDMGIYGIVSVKIGVDPEQLRHAVIELAEPQLIFFDGDEQQPSLLNLFRDSIKQTAGEFGVDIQLQGVLADEIMTVFEKFARAVENIDIRGSGSGPPSVHVDSLDGGVRALLQVVFDNVYDITQSTRVVLKSPNFIRFGLPSTLRDIPPRSIMNYLGFLVLVRVAPFLEDTLTSLRQLFGRVITRHSVDTDTKSLCLRAVDSIMPSCLSKAYYDFRASKGSSMLPREWMSQLEMIFGRLISQLSWIDEMSALLVRYRMRHWQLVRYTQHWDRAMCGPKASTVSTTPIHLYHRLSQLSQREKINTILRKADSRKWRSAQSAFSTLARYDPTRQVVYVPAGVVNSSVPTSNTLFTFHLARVAVRIYRALAEVLFDDNVYEMEAPLRFSEESHRNLDELMDCFERDMRQLQNTSSRMEVSASRRAALAQTVALHLAYEAFHELLHARRIWQIDFRFKALPDVSSDMLFFLYYALDNCESGDGVYRARRSLFRLPAESLVNIPLRHLPDFAALFNCKTGSEMVAPAGSVCDVASKPTQPP